MLENKKTIEPDDDGNTNYNWCARYSHQRISRGSGSENQRNRKKEQVHRPCQRTKKVWNKRVTVIAIAIGTLGTVSQRLGKGYGGVGKRRTN